MNQPGKLTRFLWVGAIILGLVSPAVGRDEDALPERPAKTHKLDSSALPSVSPPRVFMLEIESMDKLDNDKCVATLDEGYGYCVMTSKRRVHTTCRCGGFTGRVASEPLFRYYRVTLQLTEIRHIPDTK